MKYSDLSSFFYTLIIKKPKIWAWLGKYTFDVIWCIDIADELIWNNKNTAEEIASHLTESEHSLENYSGFFKDLVLFIASKKKKTTFTYNQSDSVKTIEIRRFKYKEKKYILALEKNRNRKKELMSFFDEVSYFEKLNEIYEKTNELAKVGGWMVDFVSEKILWTKVTKQIHEVPEDYEPDLTSGINFYKEGEDRERISKLFGEIFENGGFYQDNFQLITAKGNEITVQVYGKAEQENGKTVRVYGSFQDITEKKRKDQELAITQSRFKEIFENSPLGIILIKPNREIFHINKSALNIFGFNDIDKKNISQISFSEVIHEDYLEEVIEKGKQLVEGKLSNYKLESKFYRKSGEEFWAQIHSSLLRNENGEPRVIITQVDDITERKRLEFVSRKNAKEFKSAFDYSPNGMALVGLNGEWLRVNHNISKMLGYSNEELEGMSFMQITHPDDLDSDLNELRKLLEGEINSYTIEKRYIHKNGSFFWGLLTVSLLQDENEQPLYFISQINNITAIKQAQQQIQKALLDFQNLMDATNQVSIIGTDLEGNITKFNKGAENYLGYSAEEVIGKKVFLFHDEDEMKKRSEYLSNKYNRKIEGFEIFTFKPHLLNYDELEWTYIRKDKTTLTVNLIVTVVKNPEGEVIGYLGVSTDITQRKEMENKLVEAKYRAEAASRSKSEFLANMSHEIRTPLNGVIGFTDILMRSELSKNQRQYMETVYTSANTLLDLINDILDFSKIEAGKLELNIEKINIFDLCQETIDVIKYKAHNKGLEVLLNINPEMDNYIYGDPIRIRQILINLLGNAVKFTESGEIELKIQVEAIDSENKSVYKFSVRDTGIGIAQHNIKKVFNAFDQEDSSTTRKYGGTGLGLTITNKLLSLMNSELKVKSELGSGSEFYFSISFKTENEDDPVNDYLDKINRVLIVDDNYQNQVILQEMLSIKAITCETASNAIEALQVVENNNFDVAIIDFKMPYMTGLDLINHIRNQLHIDSEKLPVILLHSSSEEENIAKKAKELNINSVLTKPIKTEQLYKMLNQIKAPKEVDSEEKKQETTVAFFESEFKILVAEDNPVNTFLVKTILLKVIPNANILTVENGLEAYKTYTQQHESLDIIFMDIQMPIKSGFEATEDIRDYEKSEQLSAMPIIALTARTVKGERERCIDAGMTDYITKPVILDTIKNIIQQYLIDKNHQLQEAKTENELGNLEHFDKQSLLEKFDGNQDSYQELLKIVNNSFDEALVAIRKGIKKEDLQELQKIGHKLKGSAQNCCFNYLEKLAAKLENLVVFEVDELRLLQNEIQNEIDLLRKQY
ncbi:PAS domain S-box protein [Zunongwangia sp.]|uniref:PAS domain-containing hybrid sensor histidine kinase/response regulator n=1 Tax=Zunongwangia sp. TaxID=1965325 RepID=UPI003AA95A77